VKFDGVPFGTVERDAVAQTRHPGESGFALWRTFEQRNLRIRMVDYSPGYRADHWCFRGHVLLVLEGQLSTEVQGGATVTLTTGMSYQVQDDIDPHRSSTRSGARLFIVD
jgi:quercetin dioxygenase-like cupin family protein